MRAGRGDRLAASTLVARHTDKVMGLCYRMLGARDLAEDAAQETFLRVWKSAATWRAKGAKFETWLYRVAMNICLDQLRRRKRVGGVETPLEAAPDPEDGALPADAVLEEREEAAMIKNAIAALPARQRQAIVLCHYQELSNIDSAVVMGISVDAMESLLARGRRALKQALLSKPPMAPSRNAIEQRNASTRHRDGIGEGRERVER